MHVPLVDVARQHERLETELTAAFRAVLASSRFILGDEVKGIEAEIADFVATPHAVGCSNGTDALTIALQAAGVTPGDEVITSPFTFFATVGAILRLGAVPRFGDIGADDCHLDPNGIEPLITSRTRAVIAVHLFGSPLGASALRTLCESHGIRLIEDAAQALGAEERGTRVGALGHVACFSFFPSKPLGGLGDGGMITTSDGEVAERCRRLRAHGAVAPHEHIELGANCRLDELQAAFLRVKLRHLEEWIGRREAHVRAYEAALAQQPALRLLTLPQGVRSAYAHFTLRLTDVSRRDCVVQRLSEAGVQAGVYYRKPVYRQRVGALRRVLRGDEPARCPNAELRCAEVITLPLFPEMTDAERGHVVESLLGALG